MGTKGMKGEYFPKVFILDSDSSVVKSLTSIFRENGNSVIFTNSSEAAINLVRSDKPEIVYVDIDNPKDSELKLLRSFKEENSNLEIVVISGSAKIENAIGALRLGACDFLMKPFSKKDVFVAYNKALANILKRKETAEDVDNARVAIAGLAKANMEESGRTMNMICNRIERVIYPQVDQLVASTKSPSVIESLKFIRYLLNVVVPSGGGASDMADKMALLSPAEMKVARLLVQTMNAQEIADNLNLSIGTIYTHQKKMRKVLGLTNTSISLFKYFISANNKRTQ